MEVEEIAIHELPPDQHQSLHHHLHHHLHHPNKTETLKIIGINQ